MSNDKKSINEKYFQTTYLRNDIFRKFEKQFKYCFLNPINIDDKMYVEQSTDEYQKAFNMIFSSYNSDIKFFIGYTGVGKTTFIKHFFSNTTLGINSYNSDAIVIPISWDGKTITDSNFEEEIDTQISNVIDNAIDYIYKPVEELIINESESIIEFIKNTRGDILKSLTVEEIIKANTIGCSLSQYKIQKCKDSYPVECSASILKYVFRNNSKNIKRLIFVVDDLETLSQPKLSYIVFIFFKIYSCMHNVDIRPITDILISIRPHSFRFLRKDLSHFSINSYGNYLQAEQYRLLKNEIPDIKEILINRFEEAIKHTPDPGNPTTWDIAKNVFYGIINDFDNGMISMISDLCHMNIRAITDCFQMILSNRVWCQEFDEYTDHPVVRRGDYRFDIVNVIRTLACGENPVYTGKSDIQFNANSLSNIQSRPSFDDSSIFIPNILIDLHTKECDVLPAIILQFLEGYFSSNTCTPPHTEFITKNDLCEMLNTVFAQNVDSKTICNIIDYLFENRLIRKSIISKDDNETINKLNENDHLYLTLKGSRMLNMLGNDSVLLEIFREDIRREYEYEEFYKSSLELISEGNYLLLFKDIIKLINEIYISEDKYQTYIHENKEEYLFYTMDFPITSQIIKGVEKSLYRIQNIEEEYKTELNDELLDIMERIEKRKKEIKRA